MGKAQDRIVERKLLDGAPCDLDPLCTQLGGKGRIDTDCAEQLSPIGKRLLESTLDGFRPDEHLGDLVLIEQLLELAVRNGLDLCVLEP